jgi:DNA-binding transcriptional LysR family regulator
MDDLRRFAFLAAVVEAGSMSAAARALGTSTSAISQQLRQLEREGGVTLLHRTTRRLALTEAGERVHAECAALLAAARRARAQLAVSRDAPTGELRLSATVGFARHVAPALGALLAAHPALTLKLLVDDARIDLVHARVDLAIRYGALPDSPWVARRLGAFELLVCAAPPLLQRLGRPTQPQDLEAWPWLTLARERPQPPVVFTAADGAQQALRPRGRISSNNQLSLQQMCVAGLGLAMLARTDADDDLRAGRLQPLLPTPRSQAAPAHARSRVTATKRAPTQRPPCSCGPLAAGAGAHRRRRARPRRRRASPAAGAQHPAAPQRRHLRYRCAMRDRPPPSTMTSGSSRLITDGQRARQPRAWRSSVAWAGGVAVVQPPARWLRPSAPGRGGAGGRAPCRGR